MLVINNVIKVLFFEETKNNLIAIFLYLMNNLIFNIINYIHLIIYNQKNHADIGYVDYII